MKLKGTHFGVVILALGAISFYVLQDKSQTSPTQVEVNAAGEALVEIDLPDHLSAKALIGKRSFDANCATCHGANAVGKGGVGPPLIHLIYEPNHHADEAFQRAVALGVRAHHWPFGNMPAIEGLSRADVEMIIAYIRALQRANGIE